MGSNGVDIPLRWKIQVEGAQQAKQHLADLDAQFTKQQISISDYGKGQRNVLRDVRALNNEQRVQKEVYLASNPALNSFSKSMSTVGAVSNTLLGITSAINLAQIASLGVNEKVSAATQQLAADQRQYQIDLRDFPNDVALHNADLAKIAADESNLSFVNREATYQMVNNWFTLGSAVALSANQIIQTYTTLMPKIKGFSQGTQDAIGIAGLSGTFLVLGAAALVAGTQLGTGLNPENVDKFRASLDKAFGDNPFTNYIILPIAALIADLDGFKTDWQDVMNDIGDSWAGFVNIFITGFNAVNSVLSKFESNPVPNIPLMKTSSQLTQEAHANSINNMLTGQPFNSANPEQKKQTEVMTTTQKIIEDAKKTANDLVNSIQVQTNPTLQKVSEGITQSNTLLSGLVDAAQQANQRAVYQSQIQTQSNQAANIQSQISQLNSKKVGDYNPSNVDQDFNISAFEANRAKQNAKIDEQIKPLQDQLNQLEVGTQGALTSYLGSIGLSGDYGIGSVVSSALGGASAGWTSGDVQDFINTHDYGVFTRAAIRDNTVTTPTHDDQIKAWMKATGGSESEAKKALRYSASGYDGIVSSATAFVAGESGAERVSIKPVGANSMSSGQTVIIVNVAGSVLAQRDLETIISNTNKKNYKSRGFGL